MLGHIVTKKGEEKHKMMSLDNKTWIVRQIRCIANKLKQQSEKKIFLLFLTINIEKKKRGPRDSDARPTAATHENLKKQRYFTMKQQQQQHESDIKTTKSGMMHVILSSGWTGNRSIANSFRV